jgi:hypothetical protein
MKISVNNFMFQYKTSIFDKSISINFVYLAVPGRERAAIEVQETDYLSHIRSLTEMEPSQEAQATDFIHRLDERHQNSAMVTETERERETTERLPD